SVMREEVAIQVDVVLVGAMQAEKPVGIQRMHEHQALLLAERLLQVAIEQRELDASAAKPFDAVRTRDDDQHARRLARTEARDVRGERCAVAALPRVRVTPHVRAGRSTTREERLATVAI